MIGNSKNLAVALHYAAPHAPKVTAIGRGELARRIVDVGTASGVPISENPALAVALSNVEIHQEIPENLYRAVAEVLGELRPTRLNRIGLQDTYVQSGPNDELLDLYGLSPSRVAEQVVAILGRA